MLRIIVIPGSVLRFFRAKDGVGMPHRIKVSSLPSDVFRTTRTSESGQMPGRGDKLPVLSFHTLTKSMITAWPLFNEYKLHTPIPFWLPAP